MNIRDRIEKIRVIEKIDQNKNYCSQIGLINRTTFKGKPITGTTDNIKDLETSNLQYDH